ncbi:MAG TPA: hypothetical protein DCQ94_09895, partial [Nitrospira sp.]|nr:hypothetical protein [Nitrospira sp.]
GLPEPTFTKVGSGSPAFSFGRDRNLLPDFESGYRAEAVQAGAPERAERALAICLNLFCLGP